MMQRTFIVIVALITGLIFFAGAATSFAEAPKPAASQKSTVKKPHAKKKQGVKSEEEDCQLAEIKHAEKSARIEVIIGRPQ